MSSQSRFTDELKRDAVLQVVDRGYAVSEVVERFGISAKSLYTWKGQRLSIGGLTPAMKLKMAVWIISMHIV